MWTSQSSVWDIEDTAEFKYLRQKNMSLMARNKTLKESCCVEDPSFRIRCFEGQGKYYYRPYCHLVCRWSTSKGMRHKLINLQ